MTKNNQIRNLQVMLKNNLRKLVRVNKKREEKEKQLKSQNRNKKNKNRLNKWRRKNLLNQKIKVLTFRRILKRLNSI